MPSFQFQVRDRAGKVQKGQLEAPSIREAATKLREDGQFIISLLPVGGAEASASSRPGAAFKTPRGSKVKLKELLLFTRQFAVMIRAGLNLVNCLNMLVEQTESKALARVVMQIRRDVQSGEPLNIAISRHPRVFPPIYMHMVAAGEAGGQLETVLERVTEYLEREFELKKKVSGAMVYPMVIVSVAIIVVLILMTVVIPQFLIMFKDAGAELPMITKFLIFTTDILKNYWYLIFGSLGGLIFGLGYYRQTPKGRANFDRILYRAKIVGPVIQKLATARFTRTLATLMDSGLMITNALELVEKAVGNTVVAKALATARVNVTKGTGLAKPLEDTKVFPRMVTQMIAVGEETGELSQMLTEIASFYEREAGYALESMVALIEPGIIVMLGGVVAVIVAGIMIPMFEISTGATMK